MSDPTKKLRHELQAAQRALAEVKARCERYEAEHRAATKEPEENRSALPLMPGDPENTRKNIVQAHQEWMAALNVVNDPIFLHDKQFRILNCNKVYQQCAGIPFAELVGRPYYEVFPKAAAPLRSCLMAMEEEGGEEEEEVAVDGAIYRSRSFSVHDGQGVYLHSVHILEDITEHKRAETSLQESEGKFRALFESFRDAIMTVTPEGGFLSGNPAAITLFGCRDEREFTALSPALTSPEFQPDGRRSDEKAQEMMRLALQTGSHFFEWMHQRTNGTVFPADVLLTRIRMGGEPTLMASVRDITERKQAEDALRKLSQAVEQSPNSIVITDLDANIEYVNEAFVKMSGYNRTEVIGQSPRILRSGKTSREVYDDMWAHLARGEVWKGEIINRRKDGSEYIESLLVAPVRDAGGRATHYLSIRDDISARKRVEKALQESEEKFRAMSASAQDAIIMIDNDGNVSFWNNAAEKIFGYSGQEAMGKNLHTLIVPARFHDAHHQEFARFRLTGEGSMVGKTLELTALHKDGSEFPIELSLSAIKIAGQWQAISIIRDIAKRKRIEAQMAEQYEHIVGINTRLVEANKQLEQAKNQLLQSEKMAAIGLLAAGVAHEINNPVGYVNSNLGTLEKYLADIFVVMDKYEIAEALLEAGNPALEELRQLKTKIDLGYIREDTRSLIAESHHGLERIRKIILDLKDFSHSDAGEQWVWADVHHGLESTLNIVWHELKYKCEVVKEYGILPNIYCLPSQLNQVFMDLLVNAAQAIEVRGKITLRTGQEGDRIWVEVSDTGHGIPPENIPRLFDPFFTTKPVGQGTGLGLSVSYNIIEKHHGKIEVQSEVDKGSTFRVWLPVQQPDDHSNNAAPDDETRHARFPLPNPLPQAGEGANESLREFHVNTEEKT